MYVDISPLLNSVSLCFLLLQQLWAVIGKKWKRYFVPFDLCINSEQMFERTIRRRWVACTNANLRSCRGIGMSQVLVGSRICFCPNFKKGRRYQLKFGGDQSPCLHTFRRPFALLHAAPFFMYIFFSPSSSLMCSKVPSSSGTRVHFPIKFVGLWQTVIKFWKFFAKGIWV